MVVKRHIEASPESHHSSADSVDKKDWITKSFASDDDDEVEIFYRESIFD